MPVTGRTKGTVTLTDPRKPDPSGDRSWIGKGSCYQHPEPDLWFPLPRDRTTERKAKRVCITCPVAEQCLEWAVAHREVGVWGGRNERERRRPAVEPPKLKSDAKGELKPCGTVAAYRRHIAHDERPCTPCRAAESAARTRRRNRLQVVR